MKITIPYILSENAQGISTYRIEDSMFSERKIILDGTIDHDMAAAITTQLLHLSQTDSAEPVTIYINSPGGNFADGMTIYDMMQAMPCDVNTICTGLAASMAALIFSVGNNRKMLPHSTVMVHEPYIPSTGGDMFDLENRAKHLKSLREDYCKILAERSGKTTKEVYAALHKETWFTAQEAIDFGLCDEILNSL